MLTVRIARSLPMSSFDKSPMRKKTKTRTKATDDEGDDDEEDDGGYSVQVCRFCQW